MVYVCFETNSTALLSPYITHLISCYNGQATYFSDLTSVKNDAFLPIDTVLFFQ